MITRARVNKNLWYISQKKGGLGIPTIEFYYTVCPIQNQFGEDQNCMGKRAKWEVYFFEKEN